MPACLVDVVEGLEHLVGLLEQVAREAGVGLLTVPGALGPQGAHQLVEAGQLPCDRVGQLGDPQRGEVVGLDVPIEVVPGHRRAPTRRAGRGAGARRPRAAVVDRQLDVGQHVGLVALPHEQRPALAGRAASRSGGRRPAGRRRSTGSTPRRAQARSRNDRAGSTSTADPRVGHAAARRRARRRPATRARRTAPRRARPPPRRPPRRSRRRRRRTTRLRSYRSVEVDGVGAPPRRPGGGGVRR